MQDWSIISSAQCCIGQVLSDKITGHAVQCVSYRAGDLTTAFIIEESITRTEQHTGGNLVRNAHTWCKVGFTGTQKMLRHSFGDTGYLELPSRHILVYKGTAEFIRSIDG